MQGPVAVLSGQSAWLFGPRLVIIAAVVPPGRLSPGNIGNSCGAVVVLSSPAQKSPVWATESTVVSSYRFVAMYVGAMLSITKRALSENGPTTVIWLAVASKTSPVMPPPLVTTGSLLNLSSVVAGMVSREPPGGVRLEGTLVKMIGATGASTVSTRPPPETTTHAGPIVAPATRAWNLLAMGGW